MTKLREVYQAIVAQSNNGVCILSQAELMKVVGLHSRRHLLRITKELQELGLIVIERYYDRHKGQTKNRYLVRPMGQIESHQSITDGTNRVSSVQLAMSDETHRVTLLGAMGLQESLKSPMNHDNDNEKKLSQKLIIAALDFLDLPGRLKLMALPHVTPGLAEQARKYVDHLKATKQWGKGSAGKVYRLIEADAVPTQFEMPTAIAELPEPVEPIIFISRGQTQSEITPPIENAVLNSDGFWR